MDFILNGQGHGNVAATLMANNFDPRSLRPFLGADGHSYATVIRNGVQTVERLTQNAATLRKDEWIQLDTAIVKAARARLKVVADLRGAGLQYSIPNGMGHTVLQTEKMSDAGEAALSMDGLRETKGDRPHFDITNLPLPIAHSDFGFSARQVAASRNGGSPLDVSMAEQAARKVAEQIEQLTIGTLAAYAFAGGTIYGLINHPSINTKDVTDPTETLWTPATLVNEVLAMKLQSQQDYHYGPWMLYTSPSWDVYLDDDYSTAKGDNTLRERLKKIEGIQDIRTLDYLTGYKIILVQMTSDVIRMIVGMEITTLQWESKGGMQLNYKVMGILVPQIRADFNGNCGIVYGAAGL